MRSGSPFYDFSEEELVKELTMFALAEDSAAYESGDWNAEREHLRRVDLLVEACERITWLKERWAECLTDGEV